MRRVEYDRHAIQQRTKEATDDKVQMDVHASYMMVQRGTNVVLGHIHSEFSMEQLQRVLVGVNLHQSLCSCDYNGPVAQKPVLPVVQMGYQGR